MKHNDTTGPLRPPAFCLRLLLLPLLLAAVLLPAHVSADAFDRADLQRIEARVQAVAERSLPAIVALTHRTKIGMASGTGTVISKDGLILTAAHVVNGVEAVDVTFTDGTTRTAKVLGGDAGRDIALAHINEPGEYAFVEMGKSAELKVADLVVAMGHPGGYDRRRPPPVRFGRLIVVDHAGYLRTDCALIGGDSGGPLFDLAGKLVGVHSSVGIAISVNNHVPVDVAHRQWDRLLTGERWGTPPTQPALPQIPPAELAGLDVAKFRQRLNSAAIANNGKLATNPATLGKWLIESGMDAARVKAFSPAQLGEFVGKVMGANAKVETHGAPATRPATRPATQPAIASDTGSRTPGDRTSKSATKPGSMAEKPATQPTNPSTLPAGDLPPELDVAALRAKITAEAQKNNGKLNVTPALIAGWLKESGMPAEKVDAMPPGEIAGLMAKAIGARVQTNQPPRRTLAENAKAIADQDRAILATVRPDLDKVAPAVVTLLDGAQELSLGVVVREGGFILTKRSEIAKANRCASAWPAGARCAATKVREFADHDLALVRIDAQGLTAISFPSADPKLLPGSFVFTPGVEKANPLLAMGAVSVPARSLRDAGGYMGVALAESGGVVKVGSLAPGGPAEKAGLAKGDTIESIDGELVKKPADLTRRVKAMAPGAVAKIAYRRGDKAGQIAEVTLGDRAELPTPKEDGPKMPGMAVSEVRTGFPMILQHDQPLRPRDCGGPVLDLNGNVIGLNIARAGRVDAYAIPAKVIADLLGDLDFGAPSGTK